MAENKRIRVSADASPLQELRQQTQSLWEDFGRMEKSFQDKALQTVDVLKEQISLLKERNTLSSAQLFTPLSGNSTTMPFGGRIDPNLMPYGLNSNRLPSTIVGNGVGVGVDPLSKLLLEVSRIANSLEKKQRDEVNTPSRVSMNEGGGSGGGAMGDPRKGTDEGSGSTFGLGSQFRLPTNINALLGMLPFGGALMSIGMFLGQQARFSAMQYGAENELQRQNNIGNHFLLNMLTFGISGSISQVKEVGRMSASQNDRALNLYAALNNRSYKGAIGETMRELFGDEISNKEMFTEEEKYAQQAMTPTQADAYAGAFLYDLFTGGKDKMSKSVFDPTKSTSKFNISSVGSDEYHNWASRTLGLNITDYLEKFTNLQKAGVYWANTGDISDSSSSANQILLANKLRGLSLEEASQVLGKTRFDRTLMATGGERSGMTGANVIQTFDYNLQRMGKNDQYIASTLPEYLQKFSQASEAILSKVGSINTAEIVKSMTSIQASTGMEGRQLGRIQDALMGTSVSQDDVTQALLLRTAREVSGGKGNFSDLQAMIEDMPNDTNLQKKFFSKIMSMTGGGEVSRQVLKKIFPNLSMKDIIDLENSTEFDSEKIFGKGITKGGKYSEEVASSRVGFAELSTAGTMNRKIVDGINQTVEGGLKKALEEITKPIPVMVMEPAPGGAGTNFTSGKNVEFSVKPENIQDAVYKGVSMALRNLKISNTKY